MCLRRRQKLHQQAHDALAAYRLQHQAHSAALLALLGQIVMDWQASDPPAPRLQAIDALLGEDLDTMRAPGATPLGSAGNNDVPVRRPRFAPQRTLGLEVRAFLHPTSPQADTALEQASAVVLRQRQTRAPRRARRGAERRPAARWELSWVPPRGWPAVTGRQRRAGPVMTGERRYRERGVLSCALVERNSGDLCIAGREPCRASRDRLVSWADDAQPRETSWQRVGIAAAPAQVVPELQTRLPETIRTVAVAFPANPALTSVDGAPVLRRLQKHPAPEGWAWIDRRRHARRPAGKIVAVVTDTEPWLNWTAAVGPRSGFEARLTSPRQRSVTAIFGDGWSHGPPHTARSLKGVERCPVASINQRHITAQTRLDAKVGGITRSPRVLRPKRWGSGPHAAADGPQWDVYEPNRRSAYHRRDGGWGGIGSDHVSDTDMALFRSLMACGVWEAVYSVAGVRHNRAASRPETLHAAPQGQSDTVFGRAHVRAIPLMPRSRPWHKLPRDAPSEHVAHEPMAPIRELLGDPAAWPLIQTHRPARLRVGLSIRQGTSRSSTSRRKRGTESRQNRLDRAFRALGRVGRTIFFRHFMPEEDRRRPISAATNRAAAWHGGVQWVAVGSEGVIRQHNREEQRKIIRSPHLVAPLGVLHHGVAMTRV
jgi:TnpA family transposase